MFKKLKLKREDIRQKKLIKMAEDNGIYILPSCRNHKQLIVVRVDGMRSSMIGLGGWYTSQKKRAEIAERELKERTYVVFSFCFI